MFRVVGGDEFDKSREEPITAIGDHAQQTYPVTLARAFERGSHAARKPRRTRLNLYVFRGLVDTDHGGVHLSPLFSSSRNPHDRLHRL